MRTFLAISLFMVALSCAATDRIYALIKPDGIVFDITQYNDSAPPTNWMASLNVTPVVSPPKFVTKGWKYFSGAWLHPNGDPLTPQEQAHADREKAINVTTAGFMFAQQNWPTLSAAQQRAYVEQLIQMLQVLLLEHRELFEIPPPAPPAPTEPPAE